ncbi:response regulator [Nocardia transvalensis]|uniref:response regulator n=1 Tax=Nocardia transvalensis TaxID=37333 RepID=UPI0018944A3F|nr:response regulator transcription factor [Nocardia transvalensis]MBF6329500.1 response regulator transcription factor [Nocardia transvalensis]
MAADRSPIRVVLVDDDRLVRMALTLIIEGDAGLAVVGEAAEGNSAVDVVREQHPDVVLMDIRMPVRDGLSATAEILTWPTPPRIVVLTTFDTDDMVLQALRIGAHGFLLKDTPPPELVAAIKGAAAGLPMLSPSVTTRLIAAATAQGPSDERRSDRGAARAALATLTERELETARAIAQGMSNAEIAEHLHVSIATVKSHTSRLLTKLAVDNRVQIALLVRDAED